MIDENALELRVLGELEVVVGGRTVAVPLQAQRVLGCLAVTGPSLPREILAGRLWPDTTQVRAQANLRNALWRLRGVSRRLVRAARGQVGLRDDVTVDLARSERFARTVLDDADEGRSALVVPLALFQRDLLPSWDEEWVVAERERVRQLRINALEALSRACAGQGRFARAVEAGLAAVSADPLRDSANAALIEAHLAQGNRSDAVRHLAGYRHLLAEELGLAPSTRIETLVAAVS
jgi:DNA-binding SARP family transcriptional activator